MVPVAEPILLEEDRARVREALEGGWISSAGAFLERFEEDWARACSMPHGIAVSNGSVALDVAVSLLGLEPGDEVIVPTFTIISPVQSIVRAGGVPVLVDSNPDDWQMDVTGLEAKITSRTRAILVVHIYGHPADMDPVLEIAAKHGLAVVEDAAEVHGALYKGRPCGGIGDISTFSFYANKLITTGEGGMVLVRRAELDARARALRNLCFQPQRRFLHAELGNNFRLTNVQAAMAIGQIARLEAIVDRKRGIARSYDALLGGLPGISLPVEREWARNVYWVYGLVLDPGLDMDASGFADRLRTKGVDTRPFFLGMHEQPVFLEMGLFRGERHPVAEGLARRGLYIPSGLGITRDQIETVASAVRECLR